MGRCCAEGGERREKGMTRQRLFFPGLKKQLLQGLETIVCAHSLSLSFKSVKRDRCFPGTEIRASAPVSEGPEVRPRVSRV